MRRLASLLAILVLAGAAAAEPPAAVPAVAPDTLLARQAAHDPGLVVLDVRTPAEYAAGHVPGAINVPHDQVAARLAELAPYRDKDLVVYCGTGRRAGLALAVLGEHGFTRLGHLEGDWQAWSAAGRPAERAAPPAPAPAPKP
ncbi:MAG: rhodanese-like domain-containing protein [Proteobacteria bacterium]|nr:rhodanese-like domain-containing protein [Pseudomonadota bacterium]